MMRRVAFAVLAAVICTSTASAATTSTAPKPTARNNPFRTGRTLVIPHAGGEALYPENTLYAYKHSHALGGDVIDLDVQTTSVVAPICAILKLLRREAISYVGIETSPQVNEFRRLCPAVHTSGTDEERTAMRAARDRGDTTFQTTVTVNQPSYIGRDGKPRITQAYLDFAHDRGIAVLTWVVDDPAIMRRLVAMGIDGISTRRPDLLLPIVHPNGT